MTLVTYNNGYIPASLLITFNVGWSSGEGEWKHQLSAGTYSKHLALVALAKRNTGRTLAISSGWGAYRPYPAQVYARKVHGNGAATPGTSSHGGFWEGQQTLAIDYGNWSYVYGGDRAAFYRDARAVGFEPGLIHPSRNRTYPDEPWHVVDKQPWAAGAANTGGGQPQSEEDDMPSEKWLIQLGADIVSQVNNSIKADIATVHNTVINGNRSLGDAVSAIRADVNYIHTLSPYSLKAILEANRSGAVVLTDAQAKAIGGQLAASAVAGIDAALRDDFEGVKTLLSRLPQETITALKSAL